MNSSRPNPTFFELTLFVDYGNIRYLFFALCLLIYMIIISANMGIIVTIFLEKSLHEPMYVFICCLSANSLYGSSGFFPRFLLDLLSDAHFISRPSCFVQIYVIYTYAFSEFSILAVMAYDRLVAICQPLHYRGKMTVRKAGFLWAAAVLHPALSVGSTMSLTVELPLCGNKLERIFCANRPVLDNSCVGTARSDIVGQVVTYTSVLIPFFFVLYSYMRILVVCRRGGAEVRGKALQTCVPHLVTFVTYSSSFFLEVAISKYNNKVNPIVTAVLSLEYLMVPSLNNPLIYGLKLPRIRAAFARRFQIKTVKTIKTVDKHMV